MKNIIVNCNIIKYFIRCEKSTVIGENIILFAFETSIHIAEILYKTRITSYNVCYTKLLRKPSCILKSYIADMPIAVREIGHANLNVAAYSANAQIAGKYFEQYYQFIIQFF